MKTILSNISFMRKKFLMQATKIVFYRRKELHKCFPLQETILVPQEYEYLHFSYLCDTKNEIAKLLNIIL